MGSESQDNKENPEGVSAEGSEGSVGAHSVGGSKGAPLIEESEYLTPGEKFGDYQVLSCLSFSMLGHLSNAAYHKISRGNGSCVANGGKREGGIPRTI